MHDDEVQRRLAPCQDGLMKRKPVPAPPISRPHAKSSACITLIAKEPKVSIQHTGAHVIVLEVLAY